MARSLIQPKRTRLATPSRNMREFEALMESAPIGIFLTDRSGSWTYLNARCRHWLGEAPRIRGPFDWTRALHVDDRRRVTRDWREAIAAARCYAGAFRLVSGNAAVIRTNALRFHDGKVRGYIGVLEVSNETLSALAQSEARRHVAETVVRASHVLLGSRDPNTVAQEVVNCARMIFGALGALLCRIVAIGASRQLEVVAVSGDLGPAFVPGLTFSEWVGMPGLALRRHGPVVTCDVLTDGRVDLPAALRVLIQAAAYRAVMSVPVIADAAVVGTLCIMDRLNRQFTEDDIALAQAVAGQAALALENARIHEEARRRHIRQRKAAARARQQLSEKILRQREQLQALSRNILLVREAEARRIAHALHDEAGQLLGSIELAVGAIRARSGSELGSQFDRVSSLIEETEGHLRRIAHELRPTILDDLGLAPALSWLARRMASKVSVSIEAEVRTDERLPSLIETALYRIVQEALTNVIRHAQASAAEVRLNVHASVVECIVQDNGVGFVAREVMRRVGDRGLGLIGIRERAQAMGGRCRLETAPGRGTVVRITIPWRKGAPREALTG